MKISRFIFLFTLLIFGLLSCKKDEGLKDIAGTWIGSWGFGAAPPSNYEHWVLDKDGDLSAYYPDGSLYATGSWERDGDEFEAVYTPLGEFYSYTFSGFIDDDEIEGTWGQTPSAIDGGTFEMEKQ